MGTFTKGSASELAQCLEEMNGGSLQAFERFYESAVPLILPIARQLLGDRMEAEDVCHDVLLAVISHPEKFDPGRGSVEAWLAVQTKSRCLDRLRRNKKLLLTEREDLEAGRASGSSRSPEEAVLSKLEGEALRKALQELPGLQRRALAEAYFASRSQSELAEAWKVPLGTVKSRMRYGLHHLRRALVKMGWAEAERRPGDGTAEMRSAGGKMD
ncbi:MULTISPECIES: RNA polymerase sigma factor [Cohnella]|uniref:RNA polymerase sigma factor n=1 Tax=Cohnella TaxID=329857 RepID=UPI0009BA794E|nr:MULTISPECIES: sigma-70 family RNA polymerase sigma factor [Cohnella]MBN2984393.1 sigma-70 family RNA polymerase sigma factor [Cohnella algarum]